jgi:hypothetical protein
LPNLNAAGTGAVERVRAHNAASISSDPRLRGASPRVRSAGESLAATGAGSLEAIAPTTAPQQQRSAAAPSLTDELVSRLNPFAGMESPAQATGGKP